MGFVKVVKDKAYYKRFQVKLRRRRSGKTDYRARRNMIIQDKNKYNTPKYRLVVRFSNRDICAQVVSAHLEGDRVLCAAYAHELPSYGLPGKCGLSNYAAAYATGLLVGRRALTKLGLATIYKGNDKINGEDYTVSSTPEAKAQSDLKDEDGSGKRPFRVVLDVGLVRTTTGAKVFGAMKGACDAGLDVPHKNSRFPGASKTEFDAESLRSHIFGGHVANYMTYLSEEDPAKYDKQFAMYKAAGIKADGLEAVWAKVHKAIRDKPHATKKARSGFKPKKGKDGVESKKPVRRAKLTAPQRQANARTKIANLIRKAGGGDE